MDGFNRYQDIYTSTYNPRQLSETLMVPMAKRAMHEQAQKDLYSQVGELDKIDPLDVHYKEAQEIKSNLLKKIDEQSANLATKGFNFDTNADIFKTNRYIKDQFSPTGRAGMINAAKTAYFKEREDFLKNAETQKIGRDQALALWRKKTADYSGYDQARGITNVTPQGVAAHQDYEEDLSKYHSILGETEREAKSGGFHLQDSGVGDGSMIMVNSKGETTTSSNLDQVNKAARGFAAKWLHPAGEGYKYAQDAGLNITPEKVSNDFQAMIKSKIGHGTESTGSFIKRDDIKPAKMTSSNVVGTPIDTQEIGKTADDFSVFGDVGKQYQVGLGADTPSGGRAGAAGAALAGEKTPTGLQNKTFKHTDIKDPFLKRKYISTYNKLREQGIIPKTVSADDPRAAKLVSEHVQKQGPITLSSNVLTTDNEINDLGFPGTQIGKDSKERTASVVRDLKTGTVRKFIDPKTGESKSWNEMIEAGYAPSTTEYYGYMSPHSWKDTKFGAKDQNVAQHIVTIKDTKGNTYQTEISRTKNDGTPNDIKASNALKKTYQAATLEPNDFVKFKSDNPKFKNMKVMYQTKDEHGQPLGEPVFNLKFSDGKVHPMSESQYMQFIYKNFQ